MNLSARLPANFPILADQPIWLFLIIVLFGMVATWILNDLFFAWLRSRFPGFFRSRTILAILALSIVVIAIGMTNNPPSEIKKPMQRRAVGN